RGLADLVHPSPKVLEELLWDRPVDAKADGYTIPQMDEFLERIDGSLLIVGHTPLGYLPRKDVKNGVALFGQHQLVFATGYGAPPGVQSYLAIDLSKRYESVSELRYGVEIHPLYP
ncbi:hypothetical protein HYR99_28460, partial [Candidatus Poribacteria bacterium]|nr:hypothetical protein [Candidatus Poribacteria bacterium]